MPLTAPAPSSHALSSPPPREMVLGLVGSILLAVGALGVGFLPYGAGPALLPAVTDLRARPEVAALAILAVAAGAGLLTCAWLALRHRLAELTRAQLVRLLVLWSAPLALAPPLFSRDVWSYGAQGNQLTLGLDPYAVGPASAPDSPFLAGVDPLWWTAKSPYGPLFLVLARWVTEVTGPHLYLAVLGMRLLALAGVALLVVYLPRVAELLGADPRRALWLGVLNPLVLLHFVSGAHNDALMLGLAVAAVALALEGALVAGSLVAALGVVVKAPALLLVAVIGVLWSHRLTGRRPLLRGLLAAGVVTGGAFTVLTFASGLGFGWLFALSTPGTVRTWLSLPTGLAMLVAALSATAGRPVGLDGLITVGRLAGAATAAGLSAWLLLRGHGPGGQRVVRSAGLALLAVVVLGPVVHPWYLMWGLVVLAGTALSARETVWLAVGSVLFVGYSLASVTSAANELAALGSLSALAYVLGVLVTQTMPSAGPSPSSATWPALPTGSVPGPLDLRPFEQASRLPR